MVDETLCEATGECSSYSGTYGCCGKSAKEKDTQEPLKRQLKELRSALEDTKQVTRNFKAAIYRYNTMTFLEKVVFAIKGGKL